MLAIKELADTLNDAVETKCNYLALKVEYHKLTRVLHYILKNGSGELSKEQWKDCNSIEGITVYSYGVNDNGNVEIESDVQLHTN